jgi:hypothetical protein
MATSGSANGDNNFRFARELFLAEQQEMLEDLEPS